MTLILGPGRSAIDAIRAISARPNITNVIVLVAWARVGGVALFLDALDAHASKVRIAVGMAGAGTSAEALSYLRGSCAEVHLYHKHHRQTFHPKVYCFAGPGKTPKVADLIVGSSNLTSGGLFSNIEASLLVTISPASSLPDGETWLSVQSAFDGIVRSPFSERIVDDARIQLLLDQGYLSTEERLRRRNREEYREAAGAGAVNRRPQAPPPRIALPKLPELKWTFKKAEAHDPKPPTGPKLPGSSPTVSSDASFISDGLFFVSTLTANDVAKIKGKQTGTFEPDLGVTARNLAPDFWGWPDEFVEVTRTETREEWPSRARAFSSKAPGGVDVEFMQWFRAARPATKVRPKPHAAEHRFRIGPKSSFASILPVSFSVTSILVIERVDDRRYDFRIQILTDAEPGYADFKRYLVHTRPGHSFGYGPTEIE